MNFFINAVFFLQCFISFSQLMKLETFNNKISTEKIQKIEQMIQFQSEYYESLFNFKIKTLNIVLFTNLKNYKQIRKLILRHTPLNYGFYNNPSEQIFVYKNDTFLQTIYHEINHAIVSQIIENPPNWIDEGMAEFFEYCSVSANSVEVKFQPNRLSKIKKWYEKNDLDLKKFLRFSNSEWRDKNTYPNGYSYTVSYALIYYLYFKHPGAIGQIFKQIKNGSNSLDALEAATKTKIKVFEKDFETFFNSY